MKASLIPDHENSFQASGLDSQGKIHTLKPANIPIIGENSNLSYTECRLENKDESFFYKNEIKKEKIVLHFTAGYLKGDISTMTSPNNHVSVPFVIARNGEIYNLWSSKYWSYHLGPGTVGGNSNMSKKTIAIEISNIGYLKKIDDRLVTVYGDTDDYCNLSDVEYYTYIQTGFRGQTYFASFTNEQYDSIILLLRYLTSRYNIPRTFLAEDKRYEVLTTSDVNSFKGILSHINFRPNGKWDIGPAFNWARVMEGLK
ncbi:MAG: hypothetical protein CVU00_15325 [Bacteroidetes bacterium HGW-Bacteroidetes-17]|nr:MAG: hypothetical protein CVU00_15325 [Bacteroidetes bacterium HGW-Bacteroidetes-17]